MSCYKELQDSVAHQKELTKRWKEIYEEQWHAWSKSQKEVNLLTKQLSNLKEQLKQEETVTFEQFEKWYKDQHPKLYDSELGQNGQFDEFPFVAWDEIKNNKCETLERDLIQKSIKATTTVSSTSKLPTETKAQLFDKIMKLSSQDGLWVLNIEPLEPGAGPDTLFAIVFHQKPRDFCPRTCFPLISL